MDEVRKLVEAWQSADDNGGVDWLVEELSAMMVKAEIKTAEKILHKGYCIPEMEVQVEDFIASLKSKLEEK